MMNYGDANGLREVVGLKAVQLPPYMGLDHVTCGVQRNEGPLEMGRNSERNIYEADLEPGRVLICWRAPRRSASSS